MDKDQARFLLRSFRPDGADAHDEDFAEALKLAAEDRELCEWLAQEREIDARLAAPFQHIAPPDDLRERILSTARSDRGDLPQAKDALDAAMIGALASISVSPSFRGEILAAMETTAAGNHPRRSLWRPWAIPLAAAAGIALAFLLVIPRPGNAQATAKQLPLERVEAGFLHTFTSPLFSLDTNPGSQVELIQHLAQKKLPCPNTLPPGLRNLKGLGCRELVIEGKHGSLVCFDEENTGPVHLIIFRRDDIMGELPDHSRPHLTRHGNWAVATWADEESVFLLLSATAMEKLASLF